MMEQVDDSGELVERVAALDIGKASVMACTRIPHEDGRRRLQEVREYGTTTGALRALAGQLHDLGVTLVVMEATSDYWKPVFYLLEAEGFACWLLNARHVKNVPGRPKTDKLDAVWLAKVAERGMCRPSLVHPPARPRAARPDPLPAQPDPRAHRGEAAGREAPRRRPDQADVGGQQHLRGLRPADARRDARRPA
jgi:transposase